MSSDAKPFKTGLLTLSTECTHSLPNLLVIFVMVYDFASKLSGYQGFLPIIIKIVLGLSPQLPESPRARSADVEWLTKPVVRCVDGKVSSVIHVVQ